jgi:hypothetical protein
MIIESDAVLICLLIFFHKEKRSDNRTAVVEQPESIRQSSLEVSLEPKEVALAAC